MAVYFALALPVLLLGTGVALDYSNAASTKSKMQDALDSAVIAAILEAKNKGHEKKAVKNVYSQQVEFGKIKDVRRTSSGGHISLTSKATYELPSMFGGLTGKKVLPISVTSTASAPTKISSMQIQITRASGWWGKTVSFRGLRNGVDTEIANAVYSTVGPGLQRSFTVSESGWIDLTEYKDIYIEFRIHDNAHQFNKWCGLPGCPKKLFSTKSDENSDRFYIDGQRQPKYTTIEFEDTLSCGQRTRHAWEDGGAMSPDFEYYVTGRCDKIVAGDIYLSQ